MSAATLNDFGVSCSTDPDEELPPGVFVEEDDTAQGCGALGCRVESPLFRVGVDGLGIRILCRLHVRKYLRKSAVVPKKRVPGWLK